MNVLSLFDGMSCGQIALDKLGIKVDNYFASEIDKYAIKVTQANYPNTKQIGSVTEVKGEGLPEIDLLIGGSPCQDFSTLKFKREGLRGSKSKLFYEFLRLKNEINPKYWLLENVQMKKESKKQLDKHLGVTGILIDSNKFTAQNRKRYYWTNIPIAKIDDKNLLIDNVVDKKVDEKYYCKEHQVKHYENCKYVAEGNSIEVIDFYNKSIKYNKANCITPHAFRCDRSATNIIKVNNRLRKLTEKECERLQGVPRDYTNFVASGQRYKMIGNGWTVDIIKHIFKGLN
ncbi:MAG: DNA (cytosine-5-)-methyltransferase [Mycoplasmataceae bacterium]|nr:DNA (cytosine-5-)-methyltransferase [Mycoplasmataceae bacterium]